MGCKTIFSVKREKKILAIFLTCLLALTYIIEGYFLCSGESPPPLILCLHIFLLSLGLVAAGFYPTYLLRLLYLRLRGKGGGGKMADGKLLSHFSIFINTIIWAFMIPIMLGSFIVLTMILSGLLSIGAAAFILPPIGILFITAVDVEKILRFS
ncbi:MAG: hypothetical protein QW628_07560 [Thermofilum sp.]